MAGVTIYHVKGKGFGQRVLARITELGGPSAEEFAVIAPEWDLEIFKDEKHSSERG